MIYERIKEMRMTAMKAKDEALKGVLTVLLGEVDRIKDIKGTADDVIVTVVQKMAKNAEETIAMCKDKGVDYSESVHLISVLDNFRPKSLHEIAIRAIVEEAVDRLGHGTPVGKFMGEFKSHEGMDMKIASTILKEILNG
jgi:uncharacterized protein YqeY